MSSRISFLLLMDQRYTCLTILLTYQREQRMLLVQLPLTLPPLRSVDGTEVKTEVKSEDSASNIPQPSTALPSGKIGQLRVHASGKTVLSYGGIDFAIRLASDIGFAQDFVVM